MAQLVVRNLDEGVKRLLKQRAHRHGRSTEQEVREILGDAVRDERPQDVRLGARLLTRFAGIGLDDDIEELRGDMAQPASFDP
ncbi:MAG: toxin-antitoxin system [Alphaproteobacteria bacterium]|nr:toxin-antitoxin system [Alphaproteobacteria bacterium]